jgi:transposase
VRHLGRSRGGYSTKVHLRANADGLPIGVVLTAGEAHDATAYADLMDERDSDPGVLLGDRGYDSDEIRRDARDRGATPEIPTRRNCKLQHSVDRRLYALRSRIECFINKLKNCRRVATRYEHTASSFLGFVLLGCIRLWIRFVHAA